MEPEMPNAVRIIPAYAGNTGQGTGNDAILRRFGGIIPAYAGNTKIPFSIPRDI